MSDPALCAPFSNCRCEKEEENFHGKHFQTFLFFFYYYYLFFSLSPFDNEALKGRTFKFR